MNWSLVRAEARKLRTLRSVAGLGLAAVGIALVSLGPAWAAPAATKADWNPEMLPQAVRGQGFVVALVVLVVGVLATAGEVRHGTLPATLLVAPRRRQVLVAKLAAVSGFAVALAVTVSAVTLGLGAAVLRSAGVDAAPFGADSLATAAAVVAVAVAYAALGVGLGALVRDQTAAVVGAVVWSTVVENVLPVVLRNPSLSKWMPGGGARSLLTAATPEPGLLQPAAGALLLLVVVAAIVGGGTAAFATRDVA
ncbi:MAG TPA: hypothetical protein VM938_10985 [Acidimicrobiales bacterium]|nr:hypothetical protein [Acidimicrobiales bacterium]